MFQLPQLQNFSLKDAFQLAAAAVSLAVALAGASSTFGLNEGSSAADAGTDTNNSSPE
ncbi:hypothetical protein ACXZ66_10410 [Corynebacterium sp. S7]